jgi:hypothetical protein
MEHMAHAAAHAAPVALGVYTLRRPQASPLFRLVQDQLHRLQTVYDERVARDDGPWRPVGGEVTDTFLACGMELPPGDDDPPGAHRTTRDAGRRAHDRPTTAPGAPRAACRASPYFHNVD